MSDLGTRYAKALFDLSTESGQHSVFMEEAQFLCDTFKGDEGALRILAHPLISTEEKNAFVDKVYGGVNKDLIGFMKLAIAKNREAFLLPALTKLVEMIKLHHFQVTARVVSAVPLTQEQVARIRVILTKKIGKQVEIKLKVDPSQIAGVRIHVDGFLLDRTVKTMLKNMKGTF